MTFAQIKNATGATTESTYRFLDYINAACERWGIDTPIRQLCFLAQIGHESGGLFYTQEIASGELYEGRKDLGNVLKGDGVRFKGRGLIQITGRSNYSQLNEFLSTNLMEDPSLLGARNSKLCTSKQLELAAFSAGWFWSTRNCNKYADKININLPINTGSNLEAFKALTKVINGGFNGLEDRLSRYRRGLSVFLNK